MNALRERLKQRLGVRTALLLILALGFVLRLPGLDRDLWYDESLSLFNARGTNPLAKIIPNGPELTSDVFTRDGGWGESLVAISQIEQTPPLFFLLLRVWVKLFGESNRTLRMLSVMFGLATILAIFFLGRKLFDEKIGLGAAGMLTILPLHIQYSQEIRAYALAVLFVTLASWAYWKAYQAIGQRKERNYWLLYVGLATASLYTHYFTVGIFIAHGLFALIQPRSLRLPLVKRGVIVAAVILLLLAPWLLTQHFNHLYPVRLQPSTQIPSFWTLETPKHLASLICYLAAGWLPGMKFKSALGLILFSLYAVSALILPPAARRRQIQPAFLFSLLLVSMPILFMIGVEVASNDSGLLLFPRFALPALTGISLLFGAAILLSPQRALPFLVAATILALSAHFQVQWHRANVSTSPLPGLPWFYGNLSSAVREVNQKARPDELILFDDLYLLPTWNVYQRTLVPQLLMTRKDFFHLNRARDFDSRWYEVESKYRGIYLVRRIGEAPSEVMERLEEAYRLISHERAGRLEIRHYIKSTPAAATHPERQ